MMYMHTNKQGNPHTEPPVRCAGYFVCKISAPHHDANVTDEATTSSNEVDGDKIVDERGWTN